MKSKPYLFNLTVLSGFLLLTIGMLYPLSLNLTTMVPEPTDPLLNAWRMHWNAQAFLTGPDGIIYIFNTNIFYPYRLTLVYSEHFLLTAAQILPFLLLTDSHLVGLNLSVLLTFILSGYTMYLLMTCWTGRRWAGLIAGLLFAYSPNRFGQINHLELLITQWFPLILLMLHWTLTRSGRGYALTLILLLNLQALSGLHFFLNSLITCSLLTVAYLLTGRIRWRGGLWLTAAAAIISVALLNSPIWMAYLRFSDLMGAVRTPGEVRVYSAILTDYLTTIPHNWLYGSTFGYGQTADHVSQPLMPFGIVGLILAISGLLYLIYSGIYQRSPDSEPIKSTHLPSKPTRSLREIVSWGLFTLTLLFVSLMLSFGLNEQALGPSLSGLLTYSPYAWLYEHVLVFQAIRVPARFSMLVLISLIIMAAFGVTALQNGLSQTVQRVMLMVVVVLVLGEAWSAPLRGPEFATGENVPPVYRWLASESSPNAVILELPHTNGSEFQYEYYSTHHWRRLANGGTGYTPPVYKKLRRWFNRFPAPQSVDLIQQMGIDIVILHQDSYSAEDWNRVMDDLPRYLPAFAHLEQVGQALVISMQPTIEPPSCRHRMTAVEVRLEQQAGEPNLARVTYYNHGPAALMINERNTSRLIFADGSEKEFIEPLLTPAGQALSVNVPFEDKTLVRAELAKLARTVHLTESSTTIPATIPTRTQPLGLRFDNGSHLLDYSLPLEPQTGCLTLKMALSWQTAQAGDLSIVQLLDPFGRLVVEQRLPLLAETELFKQYSLPLVGPLPAGAYGLRVRLESPTGEARQPITEDGVTIPPDSIPPLALTVHPKATSIALTGKPLAQFENGLSLQAAHIDQTKLSPTEWLRFTLTWQTQRTLNTDYTVFTQLIGPDGQVWGQFDSQPNGGWYRTSLWLLGHPFSDVYAFPLKPNPPTGEYRLIAGLYDSQSQVRLPLANGSADFVELGTVQIRP